LSRRRFRALARQLTSCCLCSFALSRLPSPKKKRRNSAPSIHLFRRTCRANNDPSTHRKPRHVGLCEATVRFVIGAKRKSPVFKSCPGLQLKFRDMSNFKAEPAAELSVQKSKGAGAFLAHVVSSTTSHAKMIALQEPVPCKHALMHVLHKMGHGTAVRDQGCTRDLLHDGVLHVFPASPDEHERVKHAAGD